MEAGAKTYDLGLAWAWEFDRDFVQLIEDAAGAAGIVPFRIERATVGEVLEQLRKQRLWLRVVLDRASDEDESFLPFSRYVLRCYRSPGAHPPLRVINPPDLSARAADKATMHLEFLSHGVEVPYTIIISPYNLKREVELSLSELARLGRPFVIKPANTTGGGVGVVMGAETLKDILDSRQRHKNDKYLLQELVRPALLDGRRAWFRVFYAFGAILPCWWDDQTHVYREVTPEDDAAFGLAALRQITSRIQEVCRLDFFSTELVYTSERRFIAVDYVNEMCDMRLQSRHADGVPDAVVRRIAREMVAFVARETGRSG